MPSTTPNLALPYPVPADTVDVPRDVQALATKLDSFPAIKPPIVSALPATPADGDVVLLTAPGFSGRWLMRWDALVGLWQADGPTYAVSGPVVSTTAKTAAVTTYAELPSVPHIVIPFKGTYRCWTDAITVQCTAGGMQLRLGFWTGAITGAVAEALMANAFEETAMTLQDPISIAAAGTWLSLGYSTNNINATFAAIGNRFYAEPMSLTP